MGVVTWLEVEDLASLGGVAGGVGTGSAGPDSDTELRAGRSAVESGREGSWFVSESWLIAVCRRMSDSLTMLPRRRKKGMIANVCSHS